MTVAPKIEYWRKTRSRSVGTGACWPPRTGEFPAAHPGRGTGRTKSRCLRQRSPYQLPFPDGASFLVTRTLSPVTDLIGGAKFQSDRAGWGGTPIRPATSIPVAATVTERVVC